MIRGTISVAESGDDPVGDGATEATSGDSGGAADSVAAGTSSASGESADPGPSEAGVVAPDEPFPSGYVIPTDKVAVANISKDEYGDDIQEVSIELTDDGFSPAVVVVQQGLYVDWKITDKSFGDADAAQKQILIPMYGAQLDLPSEDNPLFFYPDSDFDFSTADNAFYGYLKMVDDIKTADIDAIKSEAAGINTLIWPPGTFRSDGSGNDSGASGASCH
jgi:hypothetical protein